MKNRFYKFLVMLVTVIAIGSGTTMLNLSMQEKAAGEKISFDPYIMNDHAKIPQETLLFAFQTREQPETGASFPGNESSVLEPQEQTEPAEQVQLSSQDEHVSDNMMSDVNVSTEETKEELIQLPSDNEKQTYYARLQDMDRVYTARMNAVEKETLAVQQKTAEELLELWDDELNAIYQKLRKSLSEDDFRMLRDEERAWIRNRDVAANRAAAKENYSNSTQNLAYTSSLLQWTMERVYELAAMYYGE